MSPAYERRGPELSVSDDDCEGVNTPSVNHHREQPPNPLGGQGFEGSAPESTED